jgi:hypothetical protein
MKREEKKRRKTKQTHRKGRQNIQKQTAETKHRLDKRMEIQSSCLKPLQSISLYQAELRAHATP